ncbi:MAG: efflux RND transporter periplasmic adaptor subunit [Candidatus Marinimicrobia bacterium]|nr:efflux RND transporter periplasmic adaptor subunit [Candidatus Neomarinimicrobiota bacterium]
MKNHIGFIMLLYFISIIIIKCDKNDNTENKDQPKPKSNGVTVDIDIARKGVLQEYIETAGIMESSQKGEITSFVSSYIKKIYVTEGQQVSEGDTILFLDKSIIRNNLIKARSDFIKALYQLVLELQSQKEDVYQSWYEYQMEVAEKENSVPPYPKPESSNITVMLSRLSIQTNYNQVKEYEQQLKNCIVTAPFDGIISDLEIYPRAYISAGSKLCEITNLSKMSIKVELLEEDIRDIEPGTKIHLLNDGNQTTTIESLLPRIDEDKHTGTAIAYVDNPGNVYKDGQHIQVKIEKNIYEDRLYVPRSALLNRNDRNLVFVVKDGIAKWCYVDLGFGNDQFLEITKGIEAGDTVIIGGHYSLAHNVRVKCY